MSYCIIIISSEIQFWIMEGDFFFFYVSSLNHKAKVKFSPQSSAPRMTNLMWPGLRLSSRGLAWSLPSAGFILQDPQFPTLSAAALSCLFQCVFLLTLSLCWTVGRHLLFSVTEGQR